MDDRSRRQRLIAVATLLAVGLVAAVFVLAGPGDESSESESGTTVFQGTPASTAPTAPVTQPPTSLTEESLTTQPDAGLESTTTVVGTTLDSTDTTVPATETTFDSTDTTDETDTTFGSTDTTG